MFPNCLFCLKRKGNKKTFYYLRLTKKIDIFHDRLSEGMLFRSSVIKNNFDKEFWFFIDLDDRGLFLSLA